MSPTEVRDVTLPGPGLSLPARLQLPAGGRDRLPAVLLGLGGIGTGMISSLEWLSSRLAEAGFVVLTTTWRAGSPLNDPDDIALALDWLQQQPEVDGSRLAMFGMSRGGMAALRTAAREPRLRAVCTFGAPTDLLQHVRGLAGYAPWRYKLFVEWLGGEPDENRAFYEEVQAFTHAARIRQPVLFVHGAFDMHVPMEQSIWMERELRRHGNEQVELLTIPFMNHYADVVGRYEFGFDAITDPVIAFLRRSLAA